MPHTHTAMLTTSSSGTNGTRSLAPSQQTSPMMRKKVNKIPKTYDRKSYRTKLDRML